MSAAVQGAQSAYTAAYSVSHKGQGLRENFFTYKARFQTLVHVSQHLQQGLQETQAVIGKVLQSSLRIGRYNRYVKVACMLCLSWFYSE